MKPTQTVIRGLLLASTALVPAGAYAQAQGDVDEEIVVTGQFVPDEKRATSEISNVLDEEDLQITGDSKISDTLQRVPGLSLVGGRFILVRGLSKRYSQTLLNGAQLASPEPLERAVPLDIFPNALLSGVLVQKTYSPQYPLDFGGGVVALRSVAIPDQRFFEFDVSGSFNTVSSLQDGFTYDGPDVDDFLGADLGDRSLPDLLSDPVNDPVSQFDPALREQAGEAIRNNWSILEGTNPMDWGVGADYGDSFFLGDVKLGLIVAANFSKSWQNKIGTRRTVVIGANNELTPGDNFAADDPQCIDNDLDDCGLFNTEEVTDANGILSLGLEFNPDHLLRFNTLLLRQTTKEALIQQGTDQGSGDLQQVNRTDWIENQVLTNQVSGEHYFSLLPNANFGPTNVNWQASFVMSDRDVQDRKDVRYQYREFLQDFQLVTRALDANRTSFGDLEDETLDFSTDIVQPFSLDFLNADLKAGFAYYDQERESEFIRYFFTNPGGFAGDLDLNTLVPELIYTPQNISPEGFELEEFVDPADRFTVDFENIQAYGQIDAELFPTLRLAVGMRYEDSTQTANSFAGVGAAGDIELDGQVFSFETGEEIISETTGEYLLPSATLTWEFIPNMQLRLAGSQTVNRPTLRELTTGEFLDELDRIVRGNPALQIAEVVNADARWEWYFAPGQSMTLGGFYKQIDDPIERVAIRRANQIIRSFANAEEAEIFGVEGEIEVDIPLNDWFTWLGSRQFFWNANFSYIDSEVTAADLRTNIQTNDTRELQGQSDLLVNFRVGYEDADRGERVALLFNFTGERISDVGTEGRPDQIEEPPTLLDFVYSRELPFAGGAWEIGFEARNLLNDDFLIEQGDIVVEQYDLGRTFEVSLTARY